MFKELFTEALQKGLLTTYLKYPKDVKSFKKYLDDKNIKYNTESKNGMTRFQIDDEDKDKKIYKFVADKYNVSLIRKVK